MKKTLPILLTLSIVAGFLHLSGCATTTNSNPESASKKAFSKKRIGDQARSLRGIGVTEHVEVNEDTQEIKFSMKILFDKDEAELKSTEKKKLDKLAGEFAKYPENIVVIEGHTDSDGPAEHNRILSEKRAKAIRSYLESKKLGITSLKAIGYGESRPIASENTPEGKAKNRRVEIKISADPSRVH
ncbi:MAG: hypothetical protein BWK79_08140 [Beggiatoa sp. IS2]|nr:MAG: hypothetical protein BWK79_08140 [Beggiatoa sp. IS2]